MKAKPVKIVICKNSNSDVVQKYLFSIGYSWIERDDFNFEKDYKECKRFFGEVIFILLNDKTIAWETYKNYNNPYTKEFMNVPTIDGDMFLRVLERKEKLNKINKS